MEGIGRLYNLNNLRNMLDGDEMAVIIMIKKFIKTTPLFLSELSKYTNEGDFESAKKMLYNVNFSLDILGITSLRDELKHIDKITTQKVMSKELKELIAKLDVICDRVLIQLEEYLHEN